MSSLRCRVVIPGPACSVTDAPGQSPDLLAVYERQEAAERAVACPVCHVDYNAPRHRDRRYIQVITGPDEWDAYACPGCCPEEYVRDSERYGDDEHATQRVLDRAARDVAAGRRL